MTTKCITNLTKLDAIVYPKAQFCTKGAINKSPGAYWHNPGRMLAQTLGQSQTNPKLAKHFLQTYHQTDPELSHSTTCSRCLSRSLFFGAFSFWDLSDPAWFPRMTLSRFQAHLSQSLFSINTGTLRKPVPGLKIVSQGVGGSKQPRSHRPGARGDPAPPPLPPAGPTVGGIL